MLGAIGPFWDGNEVWLLAGGGVLFLAFPKVLASGLSGFYLGIILLLWALILRGVSFDVNRGEIFGLLGPNGAGKSTLIRILMDIIRADKGRVMVFGEPRRRDHLDRLGYLPEERGLYTKLAVVDVMTYFGALKGLSRAEA